MWDFRFSLWRVWRWPVFWDVAPCSLVEPTFQRCLLPPSSGRWVNCTRGTGLRYRNRLDKVLPHRTDDESSKNLSNVGKLLPDYTALQPRRQPSSYSPPWEPQILLRSLLLPDTSLRDSRLSFKQNAISLFPAQLYGRGYLFNRVYHTRMLIHPSVLYTFFLQSVFITILAYKMKTFLYLLWYFVRTIATACYLKIKKKIQFWNLIRFGNCLHFQARM
jgi:hypothetical protein